MSVVLATSGLIATVTIDDLGGREYVHPSTVDIAGAANSEYTYEEVRESYDLGIALDNGYISITNDGEVVGTSDQLRKIEPTSEYKNGTLMPPRITTAERNLIVNPNEGGVIYNTDTKAIEWYNASQWNSAGGGSTPLFPPDFLYQNVKIVQTLDDFPAPVGTEIQLENKTYLIDAIKLDITGYTIVYGQRSSIQGFNQNVSSIQSFENGATLFKSTTNLFMNDIEVYLSAPNQVLFDHQGDGTTPEGESFEINKMAVYCQDDNGVFQTGCCAGIIKDIRQGFMGTQFFLGFADGFKLAGTWTNGGFRITDTLWRAFAIMGQTGKVFYSDPTDPVVFESRFSSNANIQVNGASIGYDFPQTSFTFDGQYQLQNGNVSGTGTFVSLWSGLHPSTYPEANFKDNTGIINSFPGVEWISTSDNLVTIATQNVWYKVPIASATVKDATWVSYANGEVTYDSDNVLDASIITRISAVGKSNDIVEIKIVKEDSLAVQTDLIVATITIQGSASQGRAENVTIPTTAMIEKDDKLSVWIRNTSGITNVTILEGANFILGQK